MFTRRHFNAGLAASALAGLARPARALDYRGPNVVLIRFGGGVRRAETIDPSGTYAPNLLNNLAKRGVLIPDMRIEQLDGVDTSHAEGTLNLLTGRYLAYRDVGSGFGIDRLEPTEPTLFEYFREAFDVPSHEVLLINGEDRPQEEFFTFGMNPHYGISYRSEMLSLHRFKLYRTARQLADPALAIATRAQVEKERAELMAADHRGFAPEQSAPIQAFWANWRRDYGDSGFKNPRGDRLLTALTVRAMAELRPRLIMVNYQDPDYVHWGNASHYTRAIAIIDEGISRIVAAADGDPFYRDNTVFVITPDCGRDANPLMDVPYQHHFNSRSAHETFALILGPGIERDRVLDRPIDQSAIAPTIAATMGVRAEAAEGSAIDAVFR
ncbi:MAG: sulfatase-like hydrolase/transferase [Rhodobacter sp.]|nr:sulfatase-like hydrolase/transferase [Rhodobacter sp.]